MDVINKFVTANKKIFKKENIKQINRLYIIFLVVGLCLLPFSGGFIGLSGIVVVPIYFIVTRAYNNNIIKNPTTKKIIMSYSLFFGYLFIVLNLILYSIPKLLKISLDIFIVLIIVFEIMCTAFGCFYTYFSIKNDKIKEYKQADALTISSISILSGCWTIFLRRYVSTTPIEMQAFITLATLTICCCVFAFYIGKVIIPMLYCIKRYNINGFNSTND